MVDIGRGCKESWAWQVNQQAKNGSRSCARASAIVLRGALETHARPATCICVGCGGPRTRGRALQCKDVGKRRASKQAQCVHNIVRRSRVSRMKECSAGATMLLCACAGRERTFCGSVMLRKILLRFLPICVWKKDVGQHDGELAGACGLLRGRRPRGRCTRCRGRSPARARAGRWPRGDQRSEERTRRRHGGRKIRVFEHTIVDTRTSMGFFPRDIPVARIVSVHIYMIAAPGERTHESGPRPASALLTIGLLSTPLSVL